MCTCNATSALTSGPLALDVLLIRLSCDLDLVVSYYPWKRTPPSTELVARVEWAMMMLLRSLEHALSDCGVSRQFTCLWNLAALSILIPLLRTTFYHASVAWVFSLATNPNPYDMWPHEGLEYYWQVGPQTQVGPNLTQTIGSPHASDAKPGLVCLTRLAHGAGDCYSVMAPEKRLPAWSSMSLCVVIDQPVGNPKRKVWWV
jgi:hypothetical protein